MICKEARMAAFGLKYNPGYRPFKDNEECWNEMLKHQPFGWVKHFYSGDSWMICSISRIGIKTIYDLIYTDALCYITFADGTPFGIKEG